MYREELLSSELIKLLQCHLNALAEKKNRVNKFNLQWSIHSHRHDAIEVADKFIKLGIWQIKWLVTEKPKKNINLYFIQPLNYKYLF